MERKDLLCIFSDCMYPLNKITPAKNRESGIEPPKINNFVTYFGSNDATNTVFAA